MPDRVVEIPCGVDGKVGIVAKDFHAEFNCGIGDLLADCAEADDAELLALDLGSGKRLLGLLRGLADRGIGGVLLDPLNAANDIAAREEHRGNHEFLDAVGVRAGRIEHDDALLGVFRVGDVVDARACARDGEEIRARDELVHLGASHEDGIGLFEFLGTGVVFAQVIEPAIRNRIEAVVFVVHFLLSSVEFIMEFAVTHDDSGYYTTFSRF